MSAITRMRWDVFATLMIAIIIGAVSILITTPLLEKFNQLEDAKPYYKTVTDGSIGAIAEDNTPRLSTMEEIKSHHGPFTMEVTNYLLGGIRFTTSSGYISMFDYIELDTGEYVLAKIYGGSVFAVEQKYVLPIGVVVHEPLDIPDPSDLLQTYGELDTSFYIDMLGKQTTYTSKAVDSVSKSAEDLAVLVGIVSFLLVRFVAVGIGFFPPMLPRRKA